MNRVKRGASACVFLLTLVFMISVTGCFYSPVTEITDESADLSVPMDAQQRQEVTLEVWHAVSGTAGQAFSAEVEAFDEANDLAEVRLSYSGGANESAAKISAALLAGNAPDVALMYAGPAFTGSLGNFTAEQLIQRDDFAAEDIYPGIWDYCKYYTKDAVCAVPYGISTQVLYYNKDILADAGVDMSNPPKTWDEFYNVCLQVLEKENAKGNEAFSVFDADPAGWLFRSMLMQNGCGVVESDAREGINPVFDSEEGIEVAQYWKKLVDSGIMAADEHDLAESKFLAGNLAFIAMSSNRISRWEDAEINIGAIEMPYFTEPSLALSGNVLVIFTQDRQKIEAAWDLVSYLLEPERHSAFALETGYLPVYQSALKLENVSRAVEENELYSVAFRQLSYAHSCVHFEEMGTMNLEIDEALSHIERGVLSPQQALCDAAKRVREEIAADKS